MDPKGCVLLIAKLSPCCTGNLPNKLLAGLLSNPPHLLKAVLKGEKKAQDQGRREEEHGLAVEKGS